MKTITAEDIRNLYLPPAGSHKGQNGRLMIIGGSQLFHAASLWSLTVASRIVDLVHYASVPENNELVRKAKDEFRNGIVIPRKEIEEYIKEDDCILIGPGMVRTDISKIKDQRSKTEHSSQQLHDILHIQNEGEQTYALTNYLLNKFPEKQWVIDAGALQMLEIENIPEHAILTPHQGEFEGLWEKTQNQDPRIQNYPEEDSVGNRVRWFAQTYSCIVLLKGEIDIACSPDECAEIHGGNAGMTKGGTGDVLAGLIAALSCKNSPYTATIAGSVINKQAGDTLYKTVGPYFNATDLAHEIPRTMKNILEV